MKRRIAIAAAGVTFLLYAILCWNAAGWIAIPPRKSLSADRRNGPAQMKQRGVEVLSRATLRGTPYLDCRPIAGRRPVGRGRALRAQLTKKRAPLAAFGRIRGTLVLLHGWGMRKEDLLTTAERFCAAGFRCLIPDLPGHGNNPRLVTNFGTTPHEQNLPAEVCDDANRVAGPLDSRAFLWGISMGGAWAVQAAASEPARWRGVIVVSTFDELEPVVIAKAAAEAGFWIRALEPGFVLATRCRSEMWLPAVRPIDNARRLRMPTFVIHGVRDDLIPIESGRRIFDSLATLQKRWLKVDAAHHGNVLGTPQHVFAEMAEWMLARLSGKKRGPAQPDHVRSKDDAYAIVTSLQR